MAPLHDHLSDDVARIHLGGHSFGARLVTAAAANAATNKLHRMSLLQAAFSHNGFSKAMNGFFRSVVDKARISGPPDGQIRVGAREIAQSGEQRLHQGPRQWRRPWMGIRARGGVGNQPGDGGLNFVHLPDRPEAFERKLLSSVDARSMRPAIRAQTDLMSYTLATISPLPGLGRVPCVACMPMGLHACTNCQSNGDEKMAGKKSSFTLAAPDWVARPLRQI